MRKTNIALLVAVVVSSPIALAEGYDYDNGYNYENGSNSGSSSDYGRKHKNKDKDIIVKDSFNKKQIDKDVTVTKTKNSDDDFLLLKDVGNDKSRVYEDNSTFLATKTLDIDVDINKYLASSYLSGSVLGASVTYGGACCDRRKGGSGSTNVEVNQVNHMNGSFGSAAGINMAGQNAGNNSLVQQTASTNAALVGSGSGSGTGSGGSGGHY